jgi:hypothetical protein
MEGYADTIPLYEQALDAAGTTQDKYNIYLQSTQAHIDRLKATMEGLWSNTFNSSEINQTIDALTSLVEIIDKVVQSVGFFPIATGVAFAGIRLLDGGAKELGNTLGWGDGLIQRANKSLDNFSKKGKIASNTAKILNVSIKGLITSFRTLAASTLIGLGFAAVTFVLEKLITSFMRAKQAHQEYVENLRQSVQETETQVQKIEELYKQYENFNGTQEELNSLHQEMSSIMPDIISHYDAEGNAVYKTREEIEKLIEAKKQYYLESRKALYAEEIDDLKEVAKAIQDNIKARQKAEEDFNLASARKEALSFAENFINENELDKLDQYSKEYIDKVTYLNEEIKRIFSEKGQYAPDNFLFSEILQYNGIHEAVINAENELKKYSASVTNINNKLDQKKQKFASHFQTYNDIIVDSARISDKNVKKLLDNYASVFIESKNITKSNYEEILYDYEQFASKIATYIDENKINVTELIENGDVQALSNILTSVGIEFNQASKAADKFSATLSNVSDEIASNMQDAADLSKVYENTSDEIKELNNILYDLKKEQKLSADTVAELLIKYPQLASHIKKVKDGWEIERDVLETLRQEKIKEAQDAIQAQIDASTATLEQVYRRVEAFGLEIQAIKDLQSAYKEVSKLGFTQMFGEDIFKDGNIVFDESKLEIRIGDSVTQWSEEQFKNVQKAYYDQKQAYELTLSLGNLLESKNRLLELMNDPNFGVSRSSKTKKEKNKKDYLDDTQARINQINREAEARAELNKLTLERLNELEQEERYNDAIKKANELYASQQKEVSLLVEANKRLEAERRKLQGASKYDMSSWVDENGEATQTYIKLYNSLSEEGQETLKEQFDKWQLLTRAIKDNRTTVQELNKQIEETKKRIDELKLSNTQQYLDKRKKSLDDINYRLTIAEKTQALYVEGTKEYNKYEQDRLSILDEKIKYLNQEVYWTEQRLKQGDLTNEQIELLNEYLRENKLALLDAKKAAQSLMDTFSEDIIRNYKKMLEQRRDIELDYIEEQMRLEDERHEKVMDNLDRELNQFKEIIDARLKALDRANEEEDYQRKLQKLLDERAKVQEKYNTLLKDNSFEAKARRNELQKELDRLDEEIADLQRERERDLLRQSLQDQLDEREKYIEEQKNLENEKYNHNKDLLNKEKEERETYWKSILEDEQRFYQLKQQLMSNDKNQVVAVLGEIRSEYDNFFKYLESKIDFLGSMFSTISNNMKGHLDSIDSYYNSNQKSLNNTNSNTNYNNSEKQLIENAWNEYLKNKQKAEELYAMLRNGKISDSAQKAIRSEIEKLNSKNQMYRDKFGFPDGSYEQVKNLKPFSAETGGMTPAWGPEGKWLLAHEKELILNKHDTNNMLKIVDITRQIVDSIRSINLSDLIKPVQLATPSGTSTTIDNLNIYVSGNFNQKNGEDVVDSIVNGLSRKGIRIGHIRGR